MNPPKCDGLDYIHLLITTQKVFIYMEAVRYQTEEQKPLPKMPSQDCFQDSL